MKLFVDLTRPLYPSQTHGAILERRTVVWQQAPPVSTLSVVVKKELTQLEGVSPLCVPSRVETLLEYEGYGTYENTVAHSARNCHSLFFLPCCGLCDYTNDVIDVDTKAIKLPNGINRYVEHSVRAGPGAFGLLDLGSGSWGL